MICISFLIYVILEAEDHGNVDQTEEGLSSREGELTGYYKAL